jgi:tripartite-type tricarboxylate transporter receptor subunit TctC
VHFVMVANPSLPAKNVAQLIALARSRPGQIYYSSSGPGGAPHLAGELFKSMAKVNLVHVPYKGSAPSFQDLLGGQVSLTCDSLVQALPYIRDGRLVALAVLGAARSPLLPDVPTVGETLPGYELTNWFGLVAPAAVPGAVVTRIHADVVRVLKDPAIADKLSGMGATAIGNEPGEFAAAMRSDSEKWGKLIREAHIKAE